MSFLIDNDVKDRVRTAVDIVDLMSGYMELRRQGRGFVAQCPFHDDRRPSLQINPDRQIWKCWVCDIGGDVFSFMMQREGVTFPEALRMLAERANIDLEPAKKGHKGGSPSLSKDEKQSLYLALAWASQEYHRFLLDSADASLAREYLSSRGINETSIERFQLGYAPESWSWIIDRGAPRGWGAEKLEAVGLLARSEQGLRYDRFRDRVLFPIRDPQGRPIALGGRVLPGAKDDSAKYINCSETRLYSKSHQLFGLDLARDTISKTKQAIVMEGYTDVIMAHQHGITNAVAVCGTALGESHIRLLQRYCTSVVLLLDGDEAGQRRTNEIIELFIAAQMDMRVLTLPDGTDPCDYLIEHGGDQLRQLLETTLDALEHKLRTACSGFDPLIDTHRANTALEEILSTMARAPKTRLMTADAARLRQEQVLMRLSRQFGIASEDLRRRLDAMRAESSKRLRYDAAAPTVKQPLSLRYRDLTPIDREFFEILVMHPELSPTALERFPATSLGSDSARVLLETYLELELAGNELDFNSVMSAVENVAIKSLLVSIEEEAARKAEHLGLDPMERLNSLCQIQSNQDDQLEGQQRLRALESKQLSEMEEIDLLMQVVEQAKMRHGLFSPKG